GKQDAMHRMASALLERETLDANEIRMILDNQELPPVKPTGGNGSPAAEVPQQMLKPEPKHGGAFPEGSPSPA
ncbi:MAG TPA: cell division protein FtsH, partial [Acidobacteriaceae bacterium]